MLTIGMIESIMKLILLKNYKNILFLTPNFNRGGSQKFFIKYMRLLKNQIDKPNIVVLRFTKKKSYNVDNLSFSEFNSRSSLSILKLRKYIINNNIQIIFANQFQTNILALIIKIFFFKKIKIIIRETNSPFQIIRYEKNIIKKAIHFFFRKLYVYSDKIISPSKELKKELIKNYKLPKNRIEVIYNTFDRNNIIKLSKIKFDNKYNYLFKKKTFIFHGRLEFQKGLDILIKSFNIFKNSEYNLLILGEGSQINSLKKLVKNLKLSNQVFFLGFKKNPYNFIKKADYYIFPSRYEGMSNSLLDAVALSKFIIASDCMHGNREIMNIYKNGITFRSNSLISLKNTLKKINSINKIKINKKTFDNFNEQINFSKINKIINNL